MKKNTIKNMVVIPLFIATLLTSFSVMQLQNADAAVTIYRDSGDDDNTPLASDRFDDIEDGLVDTFHDQDVLATGTSSTNIRLELQQFIDCETGAAPSGTCESIDMSGDQDVVLLDQSATGFIDARANLFMLQKDDTDNQNNVNNDLTGTQFLRAATSGTGSASIDFGDELNMNMYQYNKRGDIDDEDRSTYNIDVQDAVADEDGSGNDDSNNINTALQDYRISAAGNSLIQVQANPNIAGDQDFTVAQFNAGCDDDGSQTSRDITCENNAEQIVDLASLGASRLNFDTIGPIDFEQLNTCGFGERIDCFNDGNLQVTVDTAGAGTANVELENPSSSGQPVLFQENECLNLDEAGTSTNFNDCTNVSNNFFDVDKSGANSNIQKTNLDLQVAQVNDCQDSTAPLDCTNGGLVSGIPNLNGRNIQTEFGSANTIVTVNAQGPSSFIEDADPDSLLTMENNCEADPTESSSCTNNALNEAHFSAVSTSTEPGSTVDVDRVVQDSETINNCVNLDADTCSNSARNTFVASTAGGGEINLNSDVVQTNDLLNECNSAECTNNAINAMLLTADDGATITASGSDLRQTTDLYNGCTSEADCDNVALNQFQVTADPTTTGGDVIISDLTQQISLSNTCSGSTTECSLEGTNLYTVTNTDDSPLTISPYQIIDLSCSGSTDCNKDQTNSFTYTKTGGTSLTFFSSQTATSGGADNTYTNTAGTFSGCRTLTQTNGGGPNTPSTC